MPSFEDQMTALEGVVERLERGDLPLEQSVQLFEEGMRLTAACRKELDAAEGRLQVLAERPSGRLVAVEMSLEENGPTSDEDEDEADA